MGEIAYLKMMIAASLHSVPAKEGELFERDFLKGKDQYILGKLIDQMLSDEWIYESKGHTLYCYKKTVKEILNKNGFEL